MPVDFDNEDENLKEQISKLSVDFNKKIRDLLREFFNNGNLEVNDELAFLDDKIYNSLKESGIDNLYDYITSVFASLNTDNIEYYANLTKLKSDIGKSEAVKFVTDQLKINLTGQGLKKYLANKIANTIRPQVLANADYQTTVSLLKDVIPSQIQGYVGTITKGVFAMYDGAIQQTVRKLYKPDAFYYSGSIMETSRPFCIHMREKYGNGSITWDQLKVDLDEFCPNGVPSEDLIKNNKGKMVKKGSGMHPGTNIDTFPIYCGGHEEGCNHSVDLIFY